MKTNNRATNKSIRVWVRIDPTAREILRLGALYVLYATLDKTGGFPKKAGVTKGALARGAIRSFIFKSSDERSVLRALNAHDTMIASLDPVRVAKFAYQLRPQVAGS
jgi:hypothetical protein